MIRHIAPAAGVLALLAGCHAAPSNVMPMGTQAASQFEALKAYPVEDLLGVGKVYGTKLREAGVKNTAQLLEETSTRYRRQQLAKETGIPYGNVLSLAQKVALMKIDGIGVRQSNLLQAVGVETVAELARRDAGNLAERIGIANAFKPHFVDRTPSEATVDKWIEAAKKLAKKLEADE